MRQIEPLETRIAPAAVFTFTDTDGDTVTITTSKGSNADLAAAGVLTFSNAADVPRQLQKIDLSQNAIFAGTDLTITARRGPSGDGVTAVGFIDASTTGGGTALDLGKITIDGDLGRILAGTATAGTALKAIDVRSWGLLGTGTQAAGGDLISTFTGKVGSVLVRTDFVSGTFTADGTGSLRIGGSLDEGRLNLGLGKVGSIFIGGDMIGGTGLESGSINAGEVGTFTLRGSLLGGSGTASGRFFPAKVGSIFIGGDIVAGADLDSGKIENNGASVGSLTVRGSIIGRVGSFGGNIIVGDVGTLLLGGSLIRPGAAGANVTIGDAKTVTVNGSLDGGFLGLGSAASVVVRGSLLGSDSFESGSITSGTLKSVFVGGDLIAGTGERSALLNIGSDASTKVVVRGSLISDSISGENSAGVFSDRVGSIFIGGDLIGGASGTATLNGGDAGSVFIGGIVRGGAGTNSAQIDLASIGKIRTGSIIGGAGLEAGSISTGKIGSLLVVGDVLGGAGNQLSGGIFVGGDVDSVEVRGNVVGGTADVVTLIPTAGNGGQIEIAGKVKTFKLAGDLRGGAGDNTGIVAIGGDVGTATIGGRIVGNSFAAGSIGGARFFVAGKVGSFTLGGDLVGDGTDSAKILSTRGFGTLRIGGDVIGGEGDRSGVIDGDTDGGVSALKSLFIGGSIRGGDGDESARVFVQNDDAAPGSILLRGNIQGGGGTLSGRLDADNVITKLTIEGSVTGGTGLASGFVDHDTNNLADVAAVTVKGDLVGNGQSAGKVSVDAGGKNVNAITIGGSIIGGNAAGAGQLEVDGRTVKSIIIGGSIRGGSASEAGSIEIDDADVGLLLVRGDLRGGVVANAGQIAGEKIKALTISGSIIGGQNSGTTISANGIDTFTVAGSIRGADGFPLRIESRGDFASGAHVAFGKITVGGSVSGAILHGGFKSSDSQLDADAQVGSVTVGGDWIASSLAVGVRNLGVDDAVGGSGQNEDNIDFGDGNDALAPNNSNDAALFSRIASISIGGRIRGTASPGTDHFGFVAQEILAFTLAGEKLTQAAGRSNDNLLVAATNDVRLVEL